MTDIMMYVYIAFGVMALIGFITGVIKGLWRSLLDVVFMAANALLSGIGATVLANNIAKPENISKALGEITSRASLGTDMLETVNQIQAYLNNPESNTKAVSLVIALVTVIILPIIFMAFFIVIGLVLVIPKLIIQYVCIHKPRRGAARWSGGLVCALSNIVAFAIFLMPVVGYINYANETLAMIETGQQEVAQAAQEAEKEEQKPNQLESIKTQALSYTGPISENFLIKTMGNVGGNALFEKLTTVEVDGTVVSLKTETECAVRIYNEIAVFIDVAFADYAGDQVAAIERIDETISDADFVPSVVANALSYVAIEWQNGNDVFGIEKPNLGTELQPSLDQIIGILAKTDTQSFKNDVSTICTIATVCIEDGVLKTALSENPAEIIKVLENTDVLSDVLLALHKNERFRPAIPTVSNGIINYLYKVYDEVNGTTTPKHEVIDYDSLTETDVRLEGQRISRVVYEIDAFVASIKDVDLENDQMGAMQAGDFAALGRAFNELKRSYLFKDTFEFLLEAVLESEACAQLGFIDDDFIANAIKPDADLEKMLVARQHLGILILALKDHDPQMYDSAIEMIMVSISHGEGDSLKSVLTYSNLRSLGLSKEKSKTISGLLTSMVVSFDGAALTPEETKKEAEATGKIMNAINSVLDNTSHTENIFNTSEDAEGTGTSGITADEFVETALDSKFVTEMIGNAIVDSNGEVVDDPYNIHDNMSESDLAAIENALLNEYNKEGTKDDEGKVTTIENIAHILGIDASIFN